MKLSAGITSRSIGFLAYDGVQLLSIAGPAEVFGAANRAFAERGIPPLRQPYAPRLFSPQGGTVVSASGLSLLSEPAMRTRLSDPAYGMTLMPLGSEKFLEFIQNELKLWAPVIKAGNIQIT